MFWLPTKPNIGVFGGTDQSRGVQLHHATPYGLVAFINGLAPDFLCVSLALGASFREASCITIKSIVVESVARWMVDAGIFLPGRWSGWIK